MDHYEAENTTPAPPPLLGESRVFQEMLETVSHLAPIDRPVVILGERGTGKELIAARLHYLSRRWDQPFVKVNCAALPDSLLDAELFGHEAGAFTGATRRRLGRFEAADGGTLFLDEIGTAPLSVQEKILRAVEYGAFERVGSSATVTVNVRLICATNADLPAMAAEGTFRADLLDRLAFAVLTLPPLRDRPDDIPLLADHFARAMARDLGHALFAGFSETAMGQLMSHPWPGNVRELRNAVERSVALTDDAEAPLPGVLVDPFVGHQRPSQPPSSAPIAAPPPPGGDFDAATASHARALLQGALETARFNQKDAASSLGLDYHRFRRLLKKHGL